MSVTAVRERPAPGSHLARLEALCDSGSIEPIRSGVESRLLGERALPGDGVAVAAARIDGRPVFCYAEDPSYLGGSLGSAHAESIVRAIELGRQAAIPVVGLIQSGGARLQEGHAALEGYGRIFRASVALSKVAPQISVVGGVSAGGGAYSPALTDFVVMTGAGRMFLTGPDVVRAALGEEISMEDLGGPRVHGRNGVAHFSVEDDAEVATLVRELLGLLPQRFDRPPPPSIPGEAPGDPDLPVPSESRKTYDVREVLRRILDDGGLLEVSPRWAPNMVTAMGRLEGSPVALLANQPRALGGVIDAPAAEKAAVWVARAQRFGLPLLVFVDTPGFMPGSRQEGEGVIRHGSDLLREFAAATVPKLTVILRKAYGGAVITMNSRGLGADAVFAWPGAEIGIMASGPAVEIANRRLLAAGEASRDALASAYAKEHLSAHSAAANGFVDEVIEPAMTRGRLAGALGWLGAR